MSNSELVSQIFPCRDTGKF